MNDDFTMGVYVDGEHGQRGIDRVSRFESFGGIAQFGPRLQPVVHDNESVFHTISGEIYIVKV